MKNEENNDLFLLRDLIIYGSLSLIQNRVFPNGMNGYVLHLDKFENQCLEIMGFCSLNDVVLYEVGSLIKYRCFVK